MNTDAVSAALIPSRPAWRSLLWTIPLTALWTWLIHSLPVLPESGLPALPVRLMVHTFMAIVGISPLITAPAPPLTTLQPKRALAADHLRPLRPPCAHT